MSEKDITRLFESFNRLKILIIGDVMIDHYLWGKVDRISPEAPVPVVTFIKEESRLGGAANVALNIQAMGATPFLCSVIGDDPKMQFFMELMAHKNLSAKGIITENNRLTTYKTRVIGGSQQLVRVDRETDTPVDKDASMQLLHKAEELIEQEGIHAIIFQDYDKGVITPLLIEGATEFAKKHNIPILVDPKKRNFHYYRNVTLFKPNFKEFAEGMAMDVTKDDAEGIFNAALQKQHKDNIDYLMVTLSDKGILISDGKEYVSIPAQVRDIADVSGAGDTVISIAGLCLAAGRTAREIALLSNLAGGQVCEKVGVVTIDKGQLLEEAKKLNYNI